MSITPQAKRLRDILKERSIKTIGGVRTRITRVPDKSSRLRMRNARVRMVVKIDPHGKTVRYFSDLDRCEDYMRSLRWPGTAPTCPECGSKNIGEIKTLRLLRCRDCRRKIYTKRRTIFEDSPLGLDKWFVAMWAVANCKNGISSHELARAIGVQQKSAWFMLHRIRQAMEIGDSDK